MERRTVLALIASLALHASARATTVKPVASGQLRTEWMENMRRYNGVVYYPLSGPLDRYPFLVFAPGMGKVAGDYDALLQAVASQGFVVAAIRASGPARGAGSSDYLAMMQEIFAMAGRMEKMNRERNNPLAGRINTHGYGVFGHSLGGAAAVMAAGGDESIRAVINLDGDLVGEAQQVRPRQPLAYLVSETPSATGWLERWGASKSERRRESVWKDSCERSAAPFRARMGGMQHGDFAVGGERSIAMSAALVSAFFAAHLAEGAASNDALASTLRSYPEIVTLP